MSEAKVLFAEVGVILHPSPGEAMIWILFASYVICYKKIALLHGGGNPHTPYFSLHE
jgi:hypothetical protein